MSEDAQPRQQKHRRLWIGLAAIAVLLAILIVPPLVSVSRYKARITELISASLGRPVRLSSVEARLLPRPGFVLTDLTVDEDPAYGTEPVLHANTVTASIRLLSLWRGRIELDTISVDEASLNLVRTPSGRWNLDSLVRTASAQAQSAAGEPARLEKPIRLPYLEATNSRINIKSGEEKLPFSLIDAKFSLEQARPGDWRVTLRGQPARTDLSLEQADTGVVRLEAELHQAPQLRQMPVRVDLEWREAQLGQLTRLLLGSDARWRGDLTGELHLEGTAEAAQIKTRLRATGVHRAEFAPAAPMDFDANCTFVAHFSARAIDNLLCDSPLGNGRIRLNGQLTAATASQQSEPSFTIALDRIPVAAALDAVRTVRSGWAPGLQAAGSASGHLTYAPESAAPVLTAKQGRGKTPAIVEGPLTGGITLDGLQLSGNSLSQPLAIPHVLLSPAIQSSGAGQPEALAATLAIPAGGAAPLSVALRLDPNGYQLQLRGQASIGRGRELAHLAGLSNAVALDELAGDPATVDLDAEGPWLLPQPALEPRLPGAAAVPAAPADRISGSVTLRNANWKAEFLTNAVLISQATLHISADEVRWDPVLFSYGPVKGSASLTLPVCDAAQLCTPRIQLDFGSLDAAVLQTAFLGAHERGTMLSTLIERLRPAASPAWPRIEGTVKAEALILGSVSFREPVATVITTAHGAEITAFDAGLLGGRIHATGTFRAAANAKEKPSYALEGQLLKIKPQAVGQFAGLHATGSSLDGNGKIELTGFTGDELAASAKGTLHFEWLSGGLTAGGAPAALAHFDRWTADALIANGALTLEENQVKRGAQSQTVQATVPLTDPPKIAFITPKQSQEKR
jgi:hypothetical protein